MKPQNNRFGNDLQRNNYRQSMSILSSQLARHSISGDSLIPNVYRQSVGLPNRTRNTLSVQMAQHLLRGMEWQKKQKEKLQMTNLKTTLSDLEKKINKAKKKLNTFSNIISEESDQEQYIKQPATTTKLPFKYQDQTTTGSLTKVGITNHLDYGQITKIKTYYLNHLISALQGKDRRTWEHLNISLKVLRNYYKIESPTFADLEERKVNLFRDKADANKKTLLLDIDETILHCEEDPSKTHDLALPIQIQNGSTAQAYITIRPYAISFLKRMSKHYEIIAFTASHESYADVVLDEIDPEREYIKHRLYRRNCFEIHENIYAKDLRIINRDLSSMVLIDNAPYSYIFQLQNGIPVLPYYSGEDNELVQLQKYLQEMAKCNDVRQFNKKTFKLHKYCNFSDLQDLIRDLYLSQYTKK